MKKPARFVKLCIILAVFGLGATFAVPPAAAQDALNLGRSLLDMLREDPGVLQRDLGGQNLVIDPEKPPDAEGGAEDERTPRSRQPEAITPQRLFELMSPLERDYAQRLIRVLPPEEFARGNLGSEMDRNRETRDGAVAAPSLGAAQNLARVVSAMGLPLQFGYDMFAPSRSGLSESRPINAIQRSYTLGVGDEIAVTMRGEVDATYTVTVDRDGLITLPEIPPISAAGLAFEEFRNVLRNQIERRYLETEVYATLTEVRTVNVLIVGEIVRPGSLSVPSTSTLFDVLRLAGGVEKTGSLRRMVLLRDGGERQIIDLYDVLLDGDFSADFNIRNGDRIFIPPIGRTIAVAGLAQRPGIYELPPAGDGADSVSGIGPPGPSLRFADAIALSGGLVRDSGLQVLHLSLDAGGQDVVYDIEQPANPALMPNDIIVASADNERNVGVIKLAGHVTARGARSLIRSGSVFEALRGGRLLDSDPYLLIGIVLRTDDLSFSRYGEPINLVPILNRETDVALENDDELIVFSEQDIAFLTSHEVQSVLARDAGDESFSLERPRTQPDQRQNPFAAGRQDPGEGAAQDSAVECRSIRYLRAFISRNYPGRLRQALLPDFVATDNGFRSSVSDDPADRRLFGCPQVFETNPDLLVQILEHSVRMYGEVVKPGIYPVAERATLAQIVTAAGGITRHADLAQTKIVRAAQGDIRPIEVIDLSAVSFRDIDIAAGTAISIPSTAVSSRGGRNAVLTGEFVRPGIYPLGPSTRILDVIQAAGGLTPTAYPLGALFMRETVRRQEQVAFERTARELQDAFTAAIAGGTIQGSSSETSAVITNVIAELRNTPALGRVVVEADPSVIASRPELNILLEDGDRLHMPSRPSHVLVSGEVLFPAAQMFEPGTSIEEYVEMAGGPNQLADESRTFMVLPNGRAKPVGLSFWNFENPPIPPGSAIIVPIDPAPLNILSVSRDILGVVSSAAVTAASLAAVTRD